MDKTIVISQQNLWDISLQEYGTVEAIFDVAIGNGLSITDGLVISVELILPVSQKVDRDVLNYYKGNNVRPATNQNIDYGT